ncbi:hypothetical protein CW304_30860 [Bacillus sp. UFRGS-B20]|nr:hypothetical protein CW304_30860 [Bacillus sp. UFRGS-B20]
MISAIGSYSNQEFYRCLKHMAACLYACSPDLTILLSALRQPSIAVMASRTALMLYIQKKLQLYQKKSCSFIV